MRPALATRTRQSDVMRGVVLMSIGALAIPLMDVIAKYLGQTMPSLHVAWGRFFFQLVFLIPIVIAVGGLASLRTKRPVAQLLRGVLIAGATLCFFTALKHMPVADAIAIFFVEPLILTIISAIFLGEGIGWRRMMAVVVGFVGALIVIGPEFETVGWPVLLPLGAAVFFASYLALTRSLAGDMSALATQAVAGLSGAVVLTLVVLGGTALGVEGAAPVSPDRSSWLLLIALGLLATFGHLLIVQAMHHAPASTLAPLQYLEIISAVALGYLVFGDFPDGRTWFGTAIIICSGLFVFWRARQVDDQDTAGNPRAENG